MLKTLFGAASVIMLRIASLVMLSAAFLTGCSSESKHDRGDCVAAEDGFVWFIADVDDDSYIVRGRFPHGWGSPVKVELEHGNKYQLIPSCADPFN